LSKTLAISGILIWFVTGCIISLFANRKTGKGISEFFIANRKINGFIAAMTYSATTYSSFMMVGLVGMVYVFGVSAFGFEITYLISTVLLLLYFAPKYWELGKRYNCITPSELLSKRYESNSLGKIVTVFSFIMLIPYMSVQFMGIGYLLEGLANIPYILGTFIALIVILTYTIWAGMRSVAWTDALQSLIMLISSILLVFFIIYVKLDGFKNFFSILETEHSDLLSASKMPYLKFIGLSVPWMFFALTNPQVSQRMFIARDKKSLKNMIIMFAIFGFLYTLIVVSLGLAAKCLFPAVSKSDTVTSVLLSHVPVLLALIVLISIVAASVSTVNSITLTLSSMFTIDFFKKSVKKNLFLAKLTIVLIAIIAYLFSLKRFDVIVELSVMSSAGLLAIAPSYIGIFWKKSTKAGAIISILAGGSVAIIMYSMGQFPLGIWPGIWTAIVSVITFIFFSLITTKPQNMIFESMKIE